MDKRYKEIKGLAARKYFARGNNIITRKYVHFILTDITNIILKTADPITPLTPMSSLAKNTPMTTVANSGAEEPAAIKVAPATSGDNFNS